MNKLMCKLCDQKLRDNVTLSHAIDIADRHQNFKNNYIDNRCGKRNKKLVLTDTFYLQDYTPEQLKKIDYDKYMRSANL